MERFLSTYRSLVKKLKKIGKEKKNHFIIRKITKTSGEYKYTNPCKNFPFESSQVSRTW